LPSYSKADDEILNQLVLDCVRFKFNEEEALTYIGLRFQKQVTRVTYYRRKKKSLSDPEIRAWLNEFAQAGFVRKHKNLMEGLENTLSILERELFYQASGDIKKRSQRTMIGLADSINDTVSNLRMVYLDSPFVAQLKAELDRVRVISGGEVKEEEGGKERALESRDIATARVIPMDSIAGRAQESTEEERKADKPVF
jgi:hypothetical protein